MLLIPLISVSVPGLKDHRLTLGFANRYSEFDDLRQRLVDSFPHARNALPALPPKSVICRFMSLMFPLNIATRSANSHYHDR